MKPENERLAGRITPLLRQQPMTPAELTKALQVFDDKKVPYVLGQMLKQGRAVKFDSGYYGDPQRASQIAPPQLFGEEER